MSEIAKIVGSSATLDAQFTETDITGYTAEFRFNKNGATVTKAGTLTDPANGKFQFDLTTTDLDTVGIFRAEVRLTSAGGDLTILPVREPLFLNVKVAGV